MLGPIHLHLYTMELHYEFQNEGRGTGGVVAAQVAPTKVHCLGILLPKHTKLG